MAERKDEMAWMTKIEVQEGSKKNAILKKAEGIIKRWGLKMPEGFPPLLLDFGMGDFLKTGHIEYLIVNDKINGYCGKFIFMFKGQTCPSHCHKKKHETFMVLKGAISMNMKEKGILKMKQGDILEMQQKNLHSFTAEQNSLILEVSLPSLRKDNFFENKKIGTV